MLRQTKAKKIEVENIDTIFHFKTDKNMESNLDLVYLKTLWLV